MKKSQIIGKPSYSEETRLLKETVILVSTTFVETDSYGFKDLVHKLTGVSDDSEGEKLPLTSPSRDSMKPSSGISHGCMKSGIKVTPQKFKHQRRKVHKKGEIHLGFADMSSNALPPPPITSADPHTCSSTSYCSHSTPTSVSHNSYLEEEEQELCFQPSPLQPSPLTEKREPKLLPLFPLYSMNA